MENWCRKKSNKFSYICIRHGDIHNTGSVFLWKKKESQPLNINEA
ncbi:16014_t:CDS:2 [Acaulospora colombiana]|uniref:16014_t:CDS:1 n=1 Tax=Acaulospora colombiana TaxID=27376 RepID=A0ACA9K3X5_9GLOM|nr:16014_t:CDS:2 [Acaulospora colombiana]